jgi:hypothetical protein
MFPASLSDISLIQWIAYTNRLRPLDDELTLLREMEETKRKQVLITKNYVNRAFESASFFELSGEMYVDDVLKAYDAFCSLLNEDLFEIEVPKQADIEFGQLIDAKMTLQNGSERSKWELLQYLLVIFSGEWKYDPVMLDESSDQFLWVGLYVMSHVIAFSKWWDELNTTVHNSFTVFQDSGEDEGANMKMHMERWGWINFLKSVAKTKVFDIPGSGMNSIDCARTAKMDDVLIWSSEEKDYNLAVMRDMERK